MDDKKFQALVRRLEREERAQPAWYRVRVGLLAAVGYGYIGLVLLVLLALLAAAVAIMASGRVGALIKLVIALVVAAWFILRALWVRFDPPAGRRLSRDEAPDLFAEADQIARFLQAPLADVVLLNDEYNASVSQIPRMGMFGFPRNYLCIGMPLLAALPHSHVRAVLAHEFAHLSRAHGKFGAWCYRVRMTWAQLLHALEEQQHWSAGIFRWFVHWYVPLFAAYTFVLMRRHEFEADELAANIVGREAMARTLVDLEVRGEALSSLFWPAVWAGAKQQQDPPADIYSRLARTTAKALPEPLASETLKVAMLRQTDASDTHPALRERLEHLVGDAGHQLGPSEKFPDSAMTVYFGANHELLERELSGSWRSTVARQWQEQHAAVAAAREGLARLATRPLESLTEQERFQLASWTEDLDGSESALPLYEACLALYPDHAPAAYAAGRIRLEKGDEAGLALIQRAMDRDPEAILPGCQLAIAFLERQGRQDDAAAWRDRGQARYELLMAANAERQQIRTKDRFVRSNLDAAHREALVRQLDQHESVRRAFLVRKTVQHLASEEPMHVLLVQLGWPLFHFKSERAQREAAERVMQIEVPANVHLFVVADRHKELVAAVKKTPGSLLYDRRRRKAERQRERQSERQPERHSERRAPRAAVRPR